MKKVERIVLKGQNYVTPQTESVAIVSQGGVLAGSSVAEGCAKLSGYGKGTGF
ncbi:MAG: hypothetical protein KBT57_06565 [bacterium]|nr:hypothetical protein [Candidatus Limimorpha equi]